MDMEPVDSRELFEEDADLPIVEMEDGSAVVELPEEEEAEEASFAENLAAKIDRQALYQIGGDIVEMVEKDKQSREKRQKQYEDGIRRTGLGDDAPGGAQFNGASRVVHPLLAEACVDFEARAIKELLPSGGPVRTSIISEDDTERLEIATMKRDILNLQITRLMPEYRDEQEALLSQLPMGGSQYLKIWHDGKRKRVEFVPIDHVFLPFSCTNFYTSPRVTHQQFITRGEFDARVRSGLYLDEEGGILESANPERSIVDKANDKIEGKEDADLYNEDGLREIYECYIDYEIDADELVTGVAPYIIHVDKATEKVLGVYRNWREDDDGFEKLHWLVEWGFIPWRGAYKLGLPHLIGGLSAAATGALRALLDSAHAANAPTLLKLRSGRLVGQTTEVAVTQVQEIEGPAGIDDIRKIVSPIPFSGPNPILFQLLGFVVDAGKGVVATAEEKIADVSDRMPVGTSLAMIEQGSKVFAAIHMRLHASQAKVLEILCRLNADYPETELWERMIGKPVNPEIFRNTDDIIPVSDPNIFSEAQRFAQMQAVMQMMSDPTIPYNRLEAHRRMLRLLNVADSDKLLPEPPKPRKLDPVQENLAAVSGVPLKVFPDQDHMAHLEVHLRFLMSPAFGAGPAFDGPKLMPILQHCSEHFALHYPQLIMQGQMTALAQGVMLPDTTLERQMAVGAGVLDQKLIAELQPFLQLYAQAQQIVQKKMPPPQLDPQAQVTMQVAQMEDARLKGEFQGKQQAEFAKMQSQQQLAQLQERNRMALEMAKLDNAKQIAMLREQVTQGIEQLRQQVELQKNAQDNEQHQLTELRKNTEDNQTQLIIALEKMRADMDARMQDSIDKQREQILSSMDMTPHIQKVEELTAKAAEGDSTKAMVETLKAMVEQMNRPKRIIEQDGKPVGIEVL